MDGSTGNVHVVKAYLCRFSEQPGALLRIWSSVQCDRTTGRTGDAQQRLPGRNDLIVVQISIMFHRCHFLIMLDSGAPVPRLALMPNRLHTMARF